MEAQNEQLLSAWLRVSYAISNSRLVSDLPYNEALLCNLLSHCPKHTATAAALCRQTGMLKSQMHRTLDQMEARGMIRRARSEADRRQIHITLLEHDRFRVQHAKSLALADRIRRQLGEPAAKQLIRSLTQLADAAEAVFRDGEPAREGEGTSS